MSLTLLTKDTVLQLWMHLSKFDKIQQQGKTGRRAACHVSLCRMSGPGGEKRARARALAWGEKRARARALAWGEKRARALAWCLSTHGRPSHACMKTCRWWHLRLHLPDSLFPPLFLPPLTHLLIFDYTNTQTHAAARARRVCSEAQHGTLYPQQHELVECCSV